METETTNTNQPENTRVEKRPLSLTSHESKCVKRVSFTPLKRTKLEAHCEQEVEGGVASSSAEQKKLKALTDANELAKKRFASRESSRRTRERERHKMDHFQNNKARLEKENERFREENQRIRNLIEIIRKSGVNSTDAKAALSNHVSSLPPKPQIPAPTTDPMSILSQLAAAATGANYQKQVPATSTPNNVNQAALLSCLQPVLQQVVLQFLSNALVSTSSQAAMRQTPTTSTDALQSQLLTVVAQCLRAAGAGTNDQQTIPPTPSPSNQQPTNWLLPPPMISTSQQQTSQFLPSSSNQQQQQRGGQEPTNFLPQQILLLQQQGNQLSSNVGHSTS